MDGAEEETTTAGVELDPWWRGWRARPGGAATRWSGRGRQMLRRRLPLLWRVQPWTAPVEAGR